jgi:hypothetical protein
MEITENRVLRRISEPLNYKTLAKEHLMMAIHGRRML